MYTWDYIYERLYIHMKMGYIRLDVVGGGLCALQKSA